MMKKFLALALLLGASSTYAADNKYYVMLDYGQLSFTNASGYSNPSKIGVGAGYNLDDTFAAELSYQINGDSTKSTSTFNGKTTTSSIVAAAVANHSLGQNFGVFGKLGLSMNSASNNYTSTTSYTLLNTTYTSTSTGSSSSTNTTLFFGLGAKYKANDATQVYLQYENFGPYSATSGSTEGSAVSVGVSYGF